MNKNLVILIIILVALAGLVAAYFFYQKPEEPGQYPTPEGIEITSIERQDDAGDATITIRGFIMGGDWIAFEAQAGVVKFLDENNQAIRIGLLETIGEWMVSPPVNFEAIVGMTTQEADLVARLEFSNENPSGDPARNKTFSFPINLKTGEPETMAIKVYFNNSKMDPEVSCNKVFPVERIVPKTEAIGTASMGELFKGPTQNEKDAGYFTSLNEGVELQSLAIDFEGIAKADFNEQLGFQVGGSCRTAAIRAQITETLRQFPTVDEVVISIDGRTEDILQP